MQTLLVATYLQATALVPNDAQAHFALAMALNRLDRDNEAMAAYRRALTLRPDFAEALNNLGISLQNTHRLDLAVTAHRRACDLCPNNADFHSNLAHALLSTQAFEEGFAQWEWRTRSPSRDFSQPSWDGGAFDGKTLLAHAEQGFGDVLQFCRYLPGVARRGGRLIVECRAPLKGLMRRIDGVEEVVTWGETLPAFDLQIAIPSLPYACRTFCREIPAQVPYLTPPAFKPDAPLRPGKKVRVGIVWQGNAAGRDPKRAVPLAEIACLARIEGVSLFSLQRGNPVASPQEQKNFPEIVDMGGQIHDFDDLAAAIEAMDLLISVDTAAAHLAGALGKPVWTLLHAASDWRWTPAPGTDPSLCLWYPTMRLYRQKQQGIWRDPIEEIAHDLAAIMSQPSVEQK